MCDVWRLQPVLEAINDSFYKIVSEALLLLQSLLRVLNPAAADATRTSYNSSSTHVAGAHVLMLATRASRALGRANPSSDWWLALPLFWACFLLWFIILVISFSFRQIALLPISYTRTYSAVRLTWRFLQILRSTTHHLCQTCTPQCFVGFVSPRRTRKSRSEQSSLCTSTFYDCTSTLSIILVRLFMLHLFYPLLPLSRDILYHSKFIKHSPHSYSSLVPPACTLSAEMLCSVGDALAPSEQSAASAHLIERLNQVVATTQVVAVRASIMLATPSSRRPADARLELVRPLLTREALVQLGSFLRKQQRALRVGALTALGELLHWSAGPVLLIFNSSHMDALWALN